jgi:sterol desaturase/sphingolipid hydroxylase (fatty acid hydroxylase superfamily)
MKKLKERWGVKSNKQIVIILLVFAITGFSSLQLAKPFLTLIGIPDTFEPHWLYRVLRLLLIFPIYQILLVFVGYIFGQFSFFWEFEKKMLERLKLGFIARYIDSILKKEP